MPSTFSSWMQVILLIHARSSVFSHSLDYSHLHTQSCLQLLASSRSLTHFPTQSTTHYPNHSLTHFLNLFQSSPLSHSLILSLPLTLPLSLCRLFSYSFPWSLIFSLTLINWLSSSPSNPPLSLLKRQTTTGRTSGNVGIQPEKQQPAREEEDGD